ncbi:hypothetical protein JCM8097_001597 [Rhodosporidiobolus ruineniae]
MDLTTYLSSTKASVPRAESIKPGKGAKKPNSSLKDATALLPGSTQTRDNPLTGGLVRQNNAIVRTLHAEDNPVTKSTSYSRTLHVASCATGHQSGGGPGRSWALHRNEKLAIQAADAESDVLKGVVAVTSGYTGRNITRLQLKQLVELQGGKVKISPSAKTTHIFILENTTASKAQKYLEAKKKNRTKLVVPEWAIECAKVGRRVGEAKYMAPVFNEAQDTVYSIMPKLERESASPSDASTSSSAASSSSSVSPPLGAPFEYPFPSTSTSASPAPAASSSRRRIRTPSPPPAPKPKPVRPSANPTSATALLLAQLSSVAASVPASPPKSPGSKRRRTMPARMETAGEVFALPPRRKRVKKEDEVEKALRALDGVETAGKRRKVGDGSKEEEPAEIVLGSSDVEIDDAASLWGAAKDEDGEGEKEEMDEWAMPPSAQRG